jgi:hypothetical protein
MVDRIMFFMKYIMKRIYFLLMICLILAGCAPASNPIQSGSSANFTFTPEWTPTTSYLSPIPNFDHIVLIVLENRDFKDVIGSVHMPYLNAFARQNVLLSNYFAVDHPSLPNYIALTSGGTQNISSDCTVCFLDQPNLADQIESSRRTWKTYQEDMPSPCFVGDADPYYQKHNPFIYFNSIRLNDTRCAQSVVPLTQLDTDLAANKLPNFSFIMPNICNSGHNCSPETADKWVNQVVTKLQSSPSLGKNNLIIITFDEGSEQSTGSCCGLGTRAGGQVVTVLISPEAKQGFVDETAYSHYSLLKTILTAWNLKDLGLTVSSQPIVAPWILMNSSNTQDNSTPTPYSTEISTTSPKNVELKFPIRGAFYYPWYPNSWDQNGLNPFTHYNPSLGYYTEDNPVVIQQHIAAMQYGKIQLGIASWWGKGHYTDARIPALLQAGEKTGFHWSLYIESEGQGDPSINDIRSDLQYIHDQYASSPAYLKIDGRFVVFVYADPNDRCGMSDRWKQANTVGAYVVLKVFTGYRTCASQPDAWHQYAPQVSQKAVGINSFTISPGFWKADEAQPRLPRDLNTWNLEIQSMIRSRARFQLITTFNEWGEGTAVESGSAWESPSGYGVYLDALHFDGRPPGLPVTNSPKPKTKP